MNIKPKSVSIAIYLIWISMLLTSVALLIKIAAIPNIINNLGHPSVVGVFISMALATAFVILLIYYIGKGKNWARITYIVIYMVSVLSLINTFMSGYEFPTHEIFMLAATHCTAILTCYLLLKKESNTWFKSDNQVKINAS